MKTALKLALLGVAASLTLSMTGCLGEMTASNESRGGTITEEEIGLRKSSLYTENQELTKGTHYIADAAGTSKVIERAFENAPPMIPHDVEGMLPIMTNNNSCTNCHIPGVAESLNATPIPKSHFVNMRPEHKMIKGKFRQVTDVMSNDTAYKEQLTLYQGRFNCTQCHAPQDTRGPAVANDFQADFRTKDGATKSNLLDVLNEGVN